MSQTGRSLIANTTLKELASAAGLTAPTVSRALRDSPRVSPATRHKVQDLAREMGYVPNHVASGLRTRRSLNLGVLVPRINRSYWSEILEGIERRACSEGYAVIVGNTGEEDHGVESCARNMLERRVDGVIRISHRKGYSPLARKTLTTRAIPLVDVDVDAQETTRESVWVGFDNPQGCCLAVQHLVELGHREMGYLGGPLEVSHIASQRYEHTVKALGHQSLKLSKQRSAFVDYSFEAGLQGATRILSARPLPTAVITSSDDQACAVLQTAQRFGLRVPVDLSVVGFGDEKVAAQMPVPLTTVRLPALHAGEVAFDCFLRQLESPDSPGRTVRLPVELICRGSTAPPNADS